MDDSGSRNWEAISGSTFFYRQQFDLQQVLEPLAKVVGEDVLDAALRTDTGAEVTRLAVHGNLARAVKLARSLDLS